MSGSGGRAFNDYLNTQMAVAGGRVGPETGLAVPHVLSINPIIGTVYGTYFHGMYDEAIRDSPQNAAAMRNDPFLMRLLNEVKDSVCSLNSSIEVDNERDPWQKAMKDGLTQMWRSIPNDIDLHWALLDAIWFGRAGSEFSWHWKYMDLPSLPTVSVQPQLPAIVGLSSTRQKMRTLGMKWHIPYEGDKIGYDYAGCPYVLVSTQSEASLVNQGAEVGIVPNIHAKSMEYGYTTAGGKALFLRTASWRERFAIHHNEMLDSPFMDAEKGDQIHGIGIRSVIYWYWWLRDEFLSNVADWCARTGLGVRLWYYDSGNPQSEAAIDKAARDQSDKVNIKIPRTPGQDPAEGVEFVDTTGSGADLLLRIVQHIEEHIELYIVGQSMSRGSQEGGSGFGDRGRTDFARDTKHQITKRQAKKYGNTCTQDILEVMKKWTYPRELWDIPTRVVFNCESPEPSEFMEGVKSFVDMGGIVNENQVRSVLGLSDVHEGDRTLGGVAPLRPGVGGGVSPEGEMGGNNTAPNEHNGENTTPKPQPQVGTFTNGKVVPDTNGVQR